MVAVTAIKVAVGFPSPPSVKEPLDVPALLNEYIGAIDSDVDLLLASAVVAPARPPGVEWRRRMAAATAAEAAEASSPPPPPSGSDFPRGSSVFKGHERKP